MPSTASPAKKIDALRKLIEHHNHLYYVEAKPAITDQQYDQLMQELMELERQHPELDRADSPSRRVGGQPLEGFTTVTHAIPMMSIDNTYDEPEVRAFDERVKKSIDDQPVQYVLEPKVDGVAASLRYEAGLLTQAATRGDGRRGDDITANVRTIHSIPLHLLGPDLPKVLEIRGEIYMTNAEFARLNSHRDLAGEEPFANPRNATAGTLKQLDSRAVAKRHLEFVAHGIGQIEPLLADDYWTAIHQIQKLGLPIAQPLVRCGDVEEVLAHVRQFEQDRRKLPYQTDGMVVKVDRFDQRDRLGARSKAPRWVIAFKYPPDQVFTLLRGVTWQVGKLGRITPVAQLDPVLVAGTTVRRATLHNIDQIQRIDVRIGDTVVVEKAGEVIPQVVSAVVEKRPPHTEPIVAPTHCPACGAKTQKDPETPYTLCINPACPTQLKRRLRAFCGRNQMDIEGLGDVLVDQLVDAGLVKTFADLYRLKKEDLLTLERMAEKSAKNVIDSIAAAKDRSLERLLSALGIERVGGRVAHVLATHFGSVAALAKATADELAEVHEIGPVTAQSVHDFFHNPAGVAAIEQLKEVGIDPRQTPAPAPDAAATANLPLSGQSIVVTGSLSSYSRPEIEALIQKLGGRPSSGVSKKTSFLVAGEDAGSKLEKAKTLGVEVISEEEFKKRIQT